MVTLSKATPPEHWIFTVGTLVLGTTYLSLEHLYTVQVVFFFTCSLQDFPFVLKRKEVRAEGWVNHAPLALAGANLPPDYPVTLGQGLYLVCQSVVQSVWVIADQVWRVTVTPLWLLCNSLQNTSLRTLCSVGQDHHRFIPWTSVQVVVFFR